MLSDNIYLKLLWLFFSLYLFFFFRSVNSRASRKVSILENHGPNRRNKNVQLSRSKAPRNDVSGDDKRRVSRCGGVRVSKLLEKEKKLQNLFNLSGRLIMRQKRSTMHMRLVLPFQRPVLEQRPCNYSWRI